MRPTQALRGGAEVPLGKHGKYLGHWGHFGSATQKGIITYSLSPNKQNPFAGAGHDAIFNTWRRFSKQVLYVAPPFIAFYYAMSWAIDRNHYLNSKAGRKEFADSE
ncbi:putative ubiquinol-cytochrome c reductase complex ubiquinone-binding protein [Rosellinia necatrix]|uniref:Cytochrome b-c1 complex subunit 8 n=1 Tax=Rosellinia necatrix TaxID=77044 RepID=A0A1S8A6Z7_ROSNE|nr:putative ubiquinol-cytochrome c reductase complex ubiquinone-binding protein [Rosellinia necatrix]